MSTIAVLAGVAIVVIAATDLIIACRKKDEARWKQTVAPCIACGSSGYIAGAFCETHVRCANPQCSMTGPNGEDDLAAINKWNALKHNSTKKTKKAPKRFRPPCILN